MRFDLSAEAAAATNADRPGENGDGAGRSTPPAKLWDIGRRQLNIDGEVVTAETRLPVSPFSEQI